MIKILGILVTISLLVTIAPAPAEVTSNGNMIFSPNQTSASLLIKFVYGD